MGLTDHTSSNDIKYVPTFPNKPKIICIPTGMGKL
jgi:hypothetical protein